MDDDRVIREITELMSEPDYYAEGWRTTRMIVDSYGRKVGMGFMYNRLMKLSDEGKLEYVFDRRGRMWWRAKK